MPDLSPGSPALRFEDRWILSRLSAAIGETTTALEGFRYCEAAQRVRDFVWNEFCDWYVELVKFRLREPEGRKTADAEDALVCRRVLAHVLDATLRLLHPVCPFITEELWHLLAETGARRDLPGPAGGEPPAPAESVVVATWPSPDPGRLDPAVEEEFERVRQVIQRVRKIRQDRNLSARETPGALILTSDPQVAERIRPHAELLKNLAALKDLDIAAGQARPTGVAVELCPGLEVAVPLPVEDPEREQKAREDRRRKRASLAAYIERESQKLSNQSFLAKAPPAVVEATCRRLEEARKQLEAIENLGTVPPPLNPPEGGRCPSFLGN